MEPAGKSAAPGTYRNEGSSGSSRTSPGFTSCGTSNSETGGSSRGSPPTSAQAAAQLVVPRSMPMTYCCDNTLQVWHTWAGSQKRDERRLATGVLLNKPPTSYLSFNNGMLFTPVPVAATTAGRRTCPPGPDPRPPRSCTVFDGGGSLNGTIGSTQRVHDRVTHHKRLRTRVLLNMAKSPRARTLPALNSQ